jgi:serine protease AprX
VATAEPLYVAAYYDTDEQRSLAERLLRAVDPDVRVFDECVQGWAAADDIRRLTGSGLMVDPLRAPRGVARRSGGGGAPGPGVARRPGAARAVRPEPGGAERPVFRTFDLDAELMGVGAGGAGAAEATGAEAEPAGAGAEAEPGGAEAGEDESGPQEPAARFVARGIDRASLEELAILKSKIGDARLGDQAEPERRGGPAFREWVPKGVLTMGPTEAAPDPAAEAPASAEPPEDVYRVEVQAPLTSEERGRLTGTGAHLLSQEDPLTLLVYLTAEQRTQVEGLEFVVHVQRREFEQSATPELVDAVRAARSAAQGPDAGLLAGVEEGAEVPDTYDVICHRPEDVPRVAELLSSTTGVQVLDTSDILVRCKIALDPEALQAVLANILAVPMVSKVAPYAAPRLYVDFARRLVGVEAINAVDGGHWTGEGEVVAFFDSGVDDAHPDLAPQLAAVEALPGATAKDMFGHGTHVAGIIAGTGQASGGTVKGVAPGAKLVSIAVTDSEGRMLLPADLGKMLGLAVAHGAHIVNLSWGIPLSGPYDGNAMMVDKFARENPDVLVVIAAGNSGQAPNGTHLINTVGTPATAKNVLTVGASASDRPGFPDTWRARGNGHFPVSPAADELVAGNADQVAAISSRGPTDYQSVKPDLLAPGTFILSTKAAQVDPRLVWAPYDPLPDRYFYTTGTSMATPMTAGAAAVVRQYLREALGVANPSAALIKAVLVASVRRLPSSRPKGAREDVGYPDFDQGFGRLDLSTILPTPDAPAARRVVFADVANDSPDALVARAPAGSSSKGKRYYTVRVAAGSTSPLRVVLTWTDYAAASVQNILELSVTGPGLPLVVGNSENRLKDLRFDQASPEFGNLLPDKLNTVQRVAVDAPQPGDYRIGVLAETTPFPPQGYALCVCGELESELVPQ